MLKVAAMLLSGHSSYVLTLILDTPGRGKRFCESAGEKRDNS